MTERGAALSDRAPACPFVAFDDDRDERADRPDHRHRCYAEIRPAPRAIAHQESYCLSPKFPSCPTFQDWARREAAHAAGGGRAADRRPARPGMEDEAAAVGVPDAADDEGIDAGAEPTADPGSFDDVEDLAPRPRSQRDWAAPPPWAAAKAEGDPGTGGGAAGGAPAGLASSRWLADVQPGDESDDEPDPGTPRRVVAGAEPEPDEVVDARPVAIPRPELAGLTTRSRRPRPAREPIGSGARERPVVGQAHPAQRLDRNEDDGGAPAWERPRRFEAYPTLRSRVGLPSVPRVMLGVIALVVAAVLVFLLPAMFLNKPDQGGGGGASPTATSSPSTSPSPTVKPVATPLTYTVKAGDTLLKIAKKFNTTQRAILAANPQIKNANLIAIGQVLVIPTPPPPDVVVSSPGSSGSPSPSAP